MADIDDIYLFLDIVAWIFWYNFWSDDTIHDFSKYLIVCAIPLNLLLWGCGSWDIREATLQKLEVFLHRSIRKILKITIQMVIDEKITKKGPRTILQYSNYPIYFSQAPTHLHRESSQKFRRPNPHPTPNSVVWQQAKTGCPTSKQQEESCPKYPSYCARCGKRWTTFNLGISGTRWELMGTFSEQARLKSFQMDRYWTKPKINATSTLVKKD